jgi:integrase
LENLPARALWGELMGAGPSMGKLNRLTALEVSRKKAPGLYADGGNLYLQVTTARTKSWIFRFMLNGRSRDMGLGSTAIVTLADARQQRDTARRLLLDGIDPIEHRNAARAQRRVAEAKTIDFKEAAEAFLATKRQGWRSIKHAEQWAASMTTYAYPILGLLPVATIDTDLVMRVLDPIWAAKPETASRIRGRIESILDYAKTRGYRDGENPARWRGHLQHMLVVKSKLRRVEHHPALPYTEIGAFVDSLRAREATAAKALEFLILTAARSAEVLQAEWSEIKLTDRMWIVPGFRMKASREHRVPLSEPAAAVLQRVRELDGRYVFPGPHTGRPLNSAALQAVLPRIGRGDITPHGFRSTFRDWAAEQTAYPNELLEIALAHTVPDKTEAAYRRGDMIEKRRRLMDDWATYGGMPSVTMGQ